MLFAACNRSSVLATVFYQSSKVTSSICGFSWHRSTASNKPSPLSTYLCACPAGTYCPSSALAASTPLTCTAGSYCAKGSTATAPCPSGHYCPSPLSLVPCPAGVVQWFGFGSVGNVIGNSSGVFCLVIHRIQRDWSLRVFSFSRQLTVMS
jgi:hypothetical protein